MDAIERKARNVLWGATSGWLSKITRGPKRIGKTRYEFIRVRFYHKNKLYEVSFYRKYGNMNWKIDHYCEE